MGSEVFIKFYLKRVFFLFGKCKNFIGRKYKKLKNSISTINFELSNLRSRETKNKFLASVQIQELENFHFF